MDVNRHNKLEMHDLLRDMGRAIICGNPQKDPEDRSRLWSKEDVINVLTNISGTKVIEGISLKLPYRGCVIDSKAFKEMRKLRLLQLDYVNLKGDYRLLQQKLRWLCWHGFPLKSIPDSLYQENLVAIDFKCSKLKIVWKKPKLLHCLTILILSHSPYLRQTPDFTELPNLEKLVMKDCPSLMIVHQSIGDLEHILVVNLKDCKCLRALPIGIYKLKSLKTLILSGCSLIHHLEEDIEQMESLTILKADNTAITTIPKSLARLEGLRHGYVSFTGLEGRAQDIFPFLIWSWMSPNNFPCNHSLADLRVMWEECQSQSQFNEEMAGLLDYLYETNLVRLESTRDLPRISNMEAPASSDGHDQVLFTRLANSFNSLLLQMGVCHKADLLKDKILQGWNDGGWDDSHLHGDQYPDWFMYKGEGCSIILKVPQVIGCPLKAILLNVVYSGCMDNTALSDQFLIKVLIINHTKDTIKHHRVDSVTSNEDPEWQNIISSVQPGDTMELFLSIGPQIPVKKITAYLIYDASEPQRLLKSLSQTLISVCQRLFECLCLKLLDERY